METGDSREREKTEKREKQKRERTARNREKGRGAIGDGRRYEKRGGGSGGEGCEIRKKWMRRNSREKNFTNNNKKYDRR